MPEADYVLRKVFSAVFFWGGGQGGEVTLLMFNKMYRTTFSWPIPALGRRTFDGLRSFLLPYMYMSRARKANSNDE